MPAEPADLPATPATSPIHEVRYSLPTLLREIQLERTTATFAMEKLDQVEIGKLFNKKRPRRVLKSGK